MSILLGSTPCTIRASSPSSLDCISEPWFQPTAQHTFPGGKGVRVDRWNLEAEKMAQLTFPNLPKGPPTETDVSSDFSSNRQGTAFFQRLSAVFTAPASGRLQLAVSSSCLMQLCTARCGSCTGPMHDLRSFIPSK